MNNELRDPLEKVSNALRRAVSINKSKEIDLRSMVNTIHHQRRRSLNTWSMEQEKFLRAKEKLLPKLTRNRASQTRDKQPTRRVTIAREVSPLILTSTGKRTKSPEMKLPSIAPNIAAARRESEIAKADVAPSMINLATSRKFFEETQRLRRISDNIQPITVNSESESSREELDKANDNKTGQNRRVLKMTTFSHNLLSQATQTETGSRTTDHTKKKCNGKKMPGIAEERGTSAKYGNETDRSKRKRENSDDDDSNKSCDKEKGTKTAKDQWKKVRDSIKQITGWRQKTDMNALSMMELARRFQDIQQCRYLRIATDRPRLTTDRAYHTSEGCRCLACTVVDKNKLKNTLSAPK